jgi:hypothetical protein
MLVDVAKHRIAFQERGKAVAGAWHGKSGIERVAESPGVETLCPVAIDAALAMVKAGNIACVFVKCTPCCISPASAGAVCSLTIPGRSRRQ